MTPEAAGTSGLDENTQMALRRAKLTAQRSVGIAFPNDFKPNTQASSLHARYGARSKEDLVGETTQYYFAGRVMLRRMMGKASFVTLQDHSGRLQIYVRESDLPTGQYAQFCDWDLGDILGVVGTVFKTNTGELSLYAKDVRLLTKAIRPMPDKFHGLSDQELRYRQRYVDLMMSEESRQVFRTRSQIIRLIREFLDTRDFLEVETPMMQVIPGGAAAKPFKTFHNALGQEMYLRISPELYLKRLVVGGFERVYEINRNFRNEGLSTRHNPEFTMLEFYQAYANYQELMDETEVLLQFLAERVLKTQLLNYQGHEIDLSKPFLRLPMIEAITHFNPQIALDTLKDLQKARALARSLNIKLDPSMGLGKVQVAIFEETVEHLLIQPTFITQHPLEISPLARQNDHDGFVTDRFEFYVGGREVANGFSELNDPEDQAERFKAQVLAKEAGDEEAMHYDADYVRALEYGMPPTAGEGIGIDRLVMLFTNQASIRDVLLFPHLRPEK